MNRQMALKDSAILPALRGVEEAFSHVKPRSQLKQKILAELDRETKKVAPSQTRTILVLVCAVMGSAAFVALCLDDAPWARSPRPMVNSPENSANPFDAPAKDPGPMISALPAPHYKQPAHVTSPNVDPAPTSAPPVSTQVLPERTQLPEPTSRLPKDQTLVPKASERLRIPMTKPTPSSNPSAGAKLEGPGYSPWTNAPVAPAKKPNNPWASFSSGDFDSTPDEPRKSPRPPVNRPKNPEKPPQDTVFDDNEAEVHVIGIYESDGGKAKVHLARSGPAILVLSAYAATTWFVTVGPDVELQRVIVLGYEDQKLEIGFDVMEIISTYEKTGKFLGCGYEWPDLDPNSGCETGDLLAKIKETFGLGASTFSGCYAGSSFTVGEEGSFGICADGYPFSSFP